MHCHYRSQEKGMGFLPSWDPEVAFSCSDAIRQRCPGILINMSTGVIGDDISAQLACLNRVKPEMAALNSGSLNYLKATSKGSWAWPPLMFDNPVDKITEFTKAMDAINCVPECECFDVGIVRSVGLYQQVGILKPPAHISLVMGVASGMPCRADLLPILQSEMPKGSIWQGVLIGRQEVWDVHRSVARLGGQLRTGLEDTLYLPNGDSATGNGMLLKALAAIAREEGRTVATPEEAKRLVLAPHQSHL